MQRSVLLLAACLAYLCATASCRNVLQNNIVDTIKVIVGGVEIDVEELTGQEAEDKISEVRERVKLALDEARAKVEASINDVNNQIDSIDTEINVDGAVDDALKDVDGKVSSALERVDAAVRDAKERVESALAEVDARVEDAIEQADQRLAEAIADIDAVEAIDTNAIQAQVQDKINERLSRMSELKHRIQNFFN